MYGLTAETEYLDLSKFLVAYALGLENNQFYTEVHFLHLSVLTNLLKKPVASLSPPCGLLRFY